jgi:hypothetical protein
VAVQVLTARLAQTAQQIQVAAVVVVTLQPKHRVVLALS